MSSPCTLTGGAFQDAEGNILENGYLECYLSQDASVSSGLNICSGVAIKIQLDSSGNAALGSQLWGNDVLSPANTYYRVTAYTAEGQPAWGPNNQQVTGSSFDLGLWVPNQVVAWVPQGSIILQQFTVVVLGSSGVEGQIAYATNGRKVGEGSGAGTGVPVYFSNGAWRVYSTDNAVQA
jgi:hypothetical protein